MVLLRDLDDDSLLRSLHGLMSTHRRVTASIVAHLAEMDERRLPQTRGFSSLFDYCLKELHFSEDEAYRRIEAARMARRFPAVLVMLEQGRVSVSVLALLKPHIDDANAAELLATVVNATHKEAKEKLAARFPLPHVVDGVRKLPTEQAQHAVPESNLAVPLATTEPVVAILSSQSAAIVPSAATARTLEPLAADRFLLKVTLTGAARDKLELARDLLRHRHPEGRLDAVVEAALDVLLEKLHREKFGRAKRPRASTRAPDGSPNRRTVPRSSRREAVARDGTLCAFVSADGRRCTSRAFLEFDHVDPVGKGGGPQPENIRVLCRAHNRFEAERVFGRAHVEAAITRAHSKRSPPRHRG